MISIAQISSGASEPLARHLIRLELPQYSEFSSAVEAGHSLVLMADGNELCLASVVLGEKSPLKIDFRGGKLGHRRHFGGGRNQDICRAVGLHQNQGISVADATAGLGRDAFVMAQQGAKVTARERNPILSTMLAWALKSAQSAANQESDEDLNAILSRLSISQADSIVELAPQSFDVVYLDPMFPERDKSAKVKKEMQILHQLLAEDGQNDEALFDSCWFAANARLVIKRPIKASFFAERNPHHQILGKSVRYDVYVKQALT